VPSKYSKFGGWGYDRREGDKKVIGIGAPVREILRAAYGVPAARMVFLSPPLEARYDFIANLPVGSQQALQKEIERKFKLIGKKAIRQTDALILTIKNPGAVGLRPAAANRPRDNSIMEPGRCVLVDEPLSSLTEFLEDYFEIPVIDGSRSAAHLDISLRWNEQEFRKNPEGLKRCAMSLALNLRRAANRSKCWSLPAQINKQYARRQHFSAQLVDRPGDVHLLAPFRRRS